MTSIDEANTKNHKYRSACKKESVFMIKYCEIDIVFGVFIRKGTNKTVCNLNVYATAMHVSGNSRNTLRIHCRISHSRAIIDKLPWHTTV